MASDDPTKVEVKEVLIAPVRHPIKAASVLFTPAHWVLRGPIYMIFVIAFGSLLYSIFATVDNTVTAVLVLNRESTTIESVGGGMVLNILAEKDEDTHYGDLLVTIQEQTRITAEAEQESLANRKYEMEKDLSKTEDEYEHSISQLKLDLADYTTGKGVKKQALEGRIKQIQQQLTTAVNTKRRELARLALAQRQYKRSKALFDQRDITISEFESAQERLSDIQKGVDDTKGKIAQIKVDLSTAKSELQEMSDLNRKKKLETELKQSIVRRDRDVKRLREQIESLSRRMIEGQKLVEGVTFKDNNTEYSSTFDGLVTDIHIKKGQIITIGTPLVTIVKDTAPLQARVLVENQDIGHLKIGQAVKIKYHAYPYQEYGIQEGVIKSIATKPGGVEGAESQYLVWVALNTEKIKKRGSKEKDLEIGLEGFAEVITGHKRLIEIVFSPAAKFFAGEEA